MLLSVTTLHKGTALLLLALGACSTPNEPSSTDSPRLVVMIVLDQFRQDYLDRFGPFFDEGGFRRFLADGTMMTNARYRHAATSTCPGHATIATGNSGNVHGIVANDWYDTSTERKVYCAEDSTEVLHGHPGGGRSPRLLLTPTIGDYLKSDDPASKVIAVAGKDRSAIMMGGHHADAAYWILDSIVTTSTYYVDRLPRWVDRFNDRRLPQGYEGTVWDRLLPAETYDRIQGADDFWNEEIFEPRHKTFPHSITLGPGGFDYRYYEALRRSPFEDEVLLAFVEDAIEAEDLGADEHIDILVVGFSSPDRIGHAYGPDSHEIMDGILRLDRMLARLLEVVDDKVGLTNSVVVLTSDHGVQSMPELVADPARGIWADRIATSDSWSMAGSILEPVLGPPGVGSDWIQAIYHPHVYLNRPLLSERGVPVERAARTLAEGIGTLNSYDTAFVAADLVGTGEAEEFSRYPGRSGDVLVRVADRHIVRSTQFGTSHGTPWENDRHVPLLWLGRSIPKQVVTDSVQIIDIAPTLAHLLSLETAGNMSGRPIEALKSTKGN